MPSIKRSPAGLPICTVEPDASSASYPFAAAAATGSTVTVPALNQKSLQGDYGFVDVLAQMGCTVEKHAEWTKVAGPGAGKLKGVDVDMFHISDTVMTLAAIAPLADGACGPSRQHCGHQPVSPAALTAACWSRRGGRALPGPPGLFPGTFAPMFCL